MKRTAVEITSHSFPVVRRGFDPAAVRAYLAMLAEEAEVSVGDDGSADAARIRSEVEAAASARIEAAEAETRAAQARIDELERALRADRGSRVAPDQAQLDADEAHRARWQEAGAAVSRLLEAADAEARRLVEAAEARASEVRQQADADAVVQRADAAREAEEIRTQARAEAVALVAEAEVERHGVVTAAAEVRAAGEREEAEREVRMEAFVQQAKAGVRTHIEDELAAARDRIEAIRAQEAEVSTRLQLVRDLVAESLGAAGSVDRTASALNPASILELVGDGPDHLAPTVIAAPSA